MKYLHYVFHHNGATDNFYATCYNLWTQRSFHSLFWDIICKSNMWKIAHLHLFQATKFFDQEQTKKIKKKLGKKFLLKLFATLCFSDIERFCSIKVIFWLYCEPFSVKKSLQIFQKFLFFIFSLVEIQLLRKFFFSFLEAYFMGAFFCSKIIFMNVIFCNFYFSILLSKLKIEKT